MRLKRTRLPSVTFEAAEPISGNRSGNLLKARHQQPTLMPPLQPLLAGRIHGFICKSCLSKLRAPRSQRPPWLLRSVASDNGPPRTKSPKKRKDSHNQHENEGDPVIRIFDQFPDGVRKEVGREPGDEALLESLQSTIRDVKEEMGADGEEGEIDDEELQDRVIGRHLQDMLPGEGFGGFMSSQIESQMQELDAKMDKRLEHVDLAKMTAEERQKLREEFIELAKAGMDGLIILGTYANKNTDRTP